MDKYISKELVLCVLNRLKQEPCGDDITDVLIKISNNALDAAIHTISIIEPYMYIPANWKEDKNDRSELS